MEDSKLTKYRSLLVHLSNMLVHDDVENAKMLLRDRLGQDYYTIGNDGRKLLDALERRNLINKNDTELLRTCLQDIERHDILEDLDEYEQEREVEKLKVKQTAMDHWKLEGDHEPPVESVAKMVKNHAGKARSASDSVQRRNHRPLSGQASASEDGTSAADCVHVPPSGSHIPTDEGALALQLGAAAPNAPRPKVQPAQKQILDDKVLLQLSKKLAREWTDLATYLNFSDAEIEQFQMDYPNNVSKQIFKMLIQWRQTEGSDVNKQTVKLCKALKDAKRRDLALFLRGLAKKARWKRMQAKGTKRK